MIRIYVKAERRRQLKMTKRSITKTKDNVMCSNRARGLERCEYRWILLVNMQLPMMMREYKSGLDCA